MRRKRRRRTRKRGKEEGRKERQEKLFILRFFPQEHSCLLSRAVFWILGVHALSISTMLDSGRGDCQLSRLLRVPRGAISC